MRKKLFAGKWVSSRRVSVVLLAMVVAAILLLNPAGSVLADGTLSWQHQTIPNAALHYIIWADDQFVTAGDDLLLVSEDGQNWQPYLQIMQANAIAYGDGKYAAVGGSGHAWASSDGIVWTAQTTGASYEYLDVIYDGTRFVAVGRNQGRMVSSDGITWEIRETGTDLMTLNAVVFHQSTYVAVGVSGKVMIYTNPLTDGTDCTIDTTGNLLAVASNSAMLVAVGSAGLIYISSDDGLSWDKADSATASDLYDVHWNADLSLWVVVGANGIILTSPDGHDWTDRSVASLPHTGIRAVSWDGTQYAAVSSNSSILRSTDGIIWSVDTLSLTAMTNNSIEGFAWNGDGSLCVAILMSGYLTVSPDGRDWTLLPDQAGLDFSDISWGDGHFVAVGYQTIQVSQDGLNWSSVDTAALGSDLDFSAITWGNGLFTAVAEWPAEIYTSPDGLSWTRRYETAEPMALLYDVIWTGSQFVAVGDFDFILASPDGISWQVISPPANPESFAYRHLAIAWGNSVFVTAGIAFGGNPCLLTSTDLLTWQRYDTGLDAQTILRDITFGSGLFVAVGDQGRSRVSGDGQNWTAPDPVTSLPLYSVQWGSGQFIAGGLSAAILAADAPAAPPDATPTAVPTAVPTISPAVTPDAPTPTPTAIPETPTTTPTATPEAPAATPSPATDPSGGAGDGTTLPSDGDGDEIVKTGESAANILPLLLLICAAVLISGRIWLRQEHGRTDA